MFIRILSVLFYRDIISIQIIKYQDRNIKSKKFYKIKSMRYERNDKQNRFMTDSVIKTLYFLFLQTVSIICQFNSNATDTTTVTSLCLNFCWQITFEIFYIIKVIVLSNRTLILIYL